MNFISDSLKFENGKLRLLDQTLLPHMENWVEIRSFEDMDGAIKTLQVRGAPLIGIAAAFCVAKMAQENCTDEELLGGIERLAKSRPTAVNLSWAMERLQKALPGGRDHLIKTAIQIYEEDVRLCAAISENGAHLIEDGDRVLTHCNTGGLATAGTGTAIGVIRAAHERGTSFEVLVDETRPLLQGARLTTYEMKKAGIPFHLICDSMAGHFMQRGQVSKVIVGADRVTRNGDSANKIGTFTLAVLAHHHRIPFYVAAPYSTFDFKIETGGDIEIEERPEIEVLSGPDKKPWAPMGAPARNPAFDVTPNELITGWITDRGYFTEISNQVFD